MSRCLLGVCNPYFLKTLQHISTVILLSDVPPDREAIASAAAEALESLEGDSQRTGGGHVPNNNTMTNSHSGAPQSLGGNSSQSWGGEDGNADQRSYNVTHANLAKVEKSAVLYNYIKEWRRKEKHLAKIKKYIHRDKNRGNSDTAMRGIEEPSIDKDVSGKGKTRKRVSRGPLSDRGKINPEGSVLGSLWENEGRDIDIWQSGNHKSSNNENNTSVNESMDKTIDTLERKEEELEEEEEEGSDEDTYEEDEYGSEDDEEEKEADERSLVETLVNEDSDETDYLNRVGTHRGRGNTAVNLPTTPHSTTLPQPSLSSLPPPQTILSVSSMMLNSTHAMNIAHHAHLSTSSYSPDDHSDSSPSPDDTLSPTVYPSSSPPLGSPPSSHPTSASFKDITSGFPHSLSSAHWEPTSNPLSASSSASRKTKMNDVMSAMTGPAQYISLGMLLSDDKRQYPHNELKPLLVYL